MKNSKRLFFIGLLFLLISCIPQMDDVTKPEEIGSLQDELAFYNFKVLSLDGDLIDFSNYKGKKVLIVNTASKCGFTPQYEELQKLHTLYGDKVTVLGFPCNQFGGQEPGGKEEIQAFCKKNYGVTFQMFDKVDVKGSTKHPLYKWLTDKSQNGWNDKEPSWNFCKYLLNEKGVLVAMYGSTTGPLSNKVLKDIGIEK